MPHKQRYRIAYLCPCSGPAHHQNLGDERLFADSLDEARTIVSSNIQKKKCTWCDGLLTNQIRIMFSEVIGPYDTYDIMGYRCACGERVEVLRALHGTGFTIPVEATVQCSKGQLRKIMNPEFLSLETWTEQTQ